MEFWLLELVLAVVLAVVPIGAAGLLLWVCAILLDCVSPAMQVRVPSGTVHKAAAKANACFKFDMITFPLQSVV